MARDLDDAKFLGVPPPEAVLASPASRYPEAASRLQPYYQDVDYLLAQAAAPKWLVGGMIAEGNLIICAGPAKKAGKSWLTLHLAWCVATGTPFLGRNVRQGGVVYANVEDGPSRIGYRMRCLGFNTGQMLQFNIVSDKRGLLPLYEAYPLLAKRFGVKLVIIDPMIKLEHAHGIYDENDGLLIDKLIDYYYSIGTSLGVSTVLNHHYRKAGDMMRGSSAMEAASAGWWDLTPGNGEVRKLTCTLRDGADQALGVKYTFTHGTNGEHDRMVLTPVPLSDAEKPPKETTRGRKPAMDDVERRAAVLKALRDAQGSSLSQDALQTAVKGSRGLVTDMIKMLVSDGVVAKIVGQDGVARYILASPE